MPEAVIVSAARSPIGRAHKGSLKDLRPDLLAAQIVRAALDAVPALYPSELDDLIMGCAQPAGEQAYNIGRVTSIRLGYDSLPGTTVHRYCASSLQAIRMAAHAIRAGEGNAFIAAGVECVSRYPQGKSDGMPDTKGSDFLAAGERSGARIAAEEPWSDPRGREELPDLHLAMGETAENVAERCGVSRERQDEFAVRSQQRAEAAAVRGFWKKDITPVRLDDGTVVDSDDGPRRGVTLEKVAGMQPAFRPNGTITAANCCPLNDGAAAVVVMSDARARELGLEPLARVVATGVSALSPEIMGLGPVEASRQALTRAGMSASDVDLVEINEAFAAQVLPCVDQLGLDPDGVNVNGGAIALGHPFGSTGARMATTLIHGLQEQNRTVGLETMCAAGGQGMALVLERLS